MVFMENAKPKTCILHDTFLYKGGGERLILAMAKILDADLAAGFFSEGSFDPRKQGFTGKMISVSTPLFAKGLRHLKLKWAFLFKTGFLREYDAVLFSGDCIEAVRNVHKDARASAADLAGVEEHAPGRGLNGGLEIGIAKNNVRRLAAKLERHALEISRRRLKNQLAHFGRARECDLVYVGMFRD